MEIKRKVKMIMSKEEVPTRGREELRPGWWKVVVVVVSVCMVALAIVLWKCCLRRRAARGKGNAQEANHIYETVEERGRETAKHVLTPRIFISLPSHN
ncbi:hypothetical protein JZ751_010667 [Albula glossodonta]|uniref:Uncharacterized protein n=1 Tax=Albula glossodonta TaxID=121402 RepID=A0A8T2NAZ4_9TELE|nr:hypothetical protein JZ751_010667 [Albula glossodonta]